MANVMIDMEKLGFLELTDHGRAVFNCDKGIAVADKDDAIAVGQIVDGQVVKSNGKYGA